MTTTHSWTNSFNFSCRSSKMPKISETRGEIPSPKIYNKFLGVPAGEQCGLIGYRNNRRTYLMQSLNSGDKTDHNDSTELTMYAFYVHI